MISIKQPKHALSDAQVCCFFSGRENDNTAREKTSWEEDESRDYKKSREGEKVVLQVMISGVFACVCVFGSFTKESGHRSARFSTMPPLVS